MFFAPFGQLGDQDRPGPVQPAHHRADRAVEHGRDLFVGEVVHVGEQHGHAELEGQFIERAHDLVADEVLEELGMARPVAEAGTK